MKKISLNVFKNGADHVLTFSYDDGKINDIRLAELFLKYNCKGTFNLNSSNIGKDGYISKEQVKKLSDSGMEIAVHAVTHPWLETLPDSVVFAEIFNDRIALEEMTGKVINGMAYPFGTFSDKVKSIAKSAGIDYARTTKSDFTMIPSDFLEWATTCHHKNLGAFIDKFDAVKWRGYIIYVWGHSYEFNTEEDWQTFEDNIKVFTNKPDYWYATNGEIYEYVTAQRSLKFSADLTKVYNPSAISVYIKVDDVKKEILPGLNIL